MLLAIGCILYRWTCRASRGWRHMSTRIALLSFQRVGWVCKHHQDLFCRRLIDTSFVFLDGRWFVTLFPVCFLPSRTELDQRGNAFGSSACEAESTIVV